MILVPHRFFPLLPLLGSIALALCPAASAIDAGDMNPHLPEKAILAAMRFQAYTRTAEDKEQWEERRAELLKSLEAQLEEASLDDNRTATALRTLIEDLQLARYVQPKGPEKQPQGEYPVMPDGFRLLVNTEFHIDKPESRHLTYPFEIKMVPSLIKVAIGGGSDDSGDRGLHYVLIDPIGRVIKRGFSDSDDYVWAEHLSTRTGTWKLIIEDLDTDLNDKRSPGNRGAVEVLVKAEQ